MWRLLTLAPLHLPRREQPAAAAPAKVSPAREPRPPVGAAWPGIALTGSLIVIIQDKKGTHASEFFSIRVAALTPSQTSPRATPLEPPAYMTSRLPHPCGRVRRAMRLKGGRHCALRDVLGGPFATGSCPTNLSLVDLEVHVSDHDEAGLGEGLSLGEVKLKSLFESLEFEASRV